MIPLSILCIVLIVFLFVEIGKLERCNHKRRLRHFNNRNQVRGEPSLYYGCTLSRDRGCYGGIEDVTLLFTRDELFIAEQRYNAKAVNKS